MYLFEDVGVIFKLVDLLDEWLVRVKDDLFVYVVSVVHHSCVGAKPNVPTIV